MINLSLHQENASCVYKRSTCEYERSVNMHVYRC